MPIWRYGWAKRLHLNLVEPHEKRKALYDSPISDGEVESIISKLGSSSCLTGWSFRSSVCYQKGWQTISTPIPKVVILLNSAYRLT